MSKDKKPKEYDFMAIFGSLVLLILGRVCISNLHNYAFFSHFRFNQRIMILKFDFVSRFFSMLNFLAYNCTSVLQFVSILPDLSKGKKPK